MSVARGTAAMLVRRRERLAQGAEPLGWKVGFNAPDVQERLGIDGPLAGFLSTDGLLEATGEQLDAMVDAVARRLADAGERLRPGERILTGMLAPPHRPLPADSVRLELDAVGGVELRFA